MDAPVLALIFIARRIQQASLSLVGREVEHDIIIVLHVVGHDVRENPSSCDCAEIRTHVPTCQKVSRAPTEPPGRPADSLLCYFLIFTSISYVSLR